MNAVAWAGRHTRSMLFVLIALVAGGVLAMQALPVSLFPEVNFPRIRINLDAGDRPAEQMERQVTRPVELAVRGIPGVRSVESTTSRGSAEVAVVFDWGQDMTAATLQVDAQANRMLSALPAGTTFAVRRMDPTVFPVIAYSLTSPTRPLTELRDLAQFQLLPIFSEVSGVAKVSVEGDATSEIHVVLDPAKLASQNLAASDVSAILAAANTLSAAGRVDDRAKLYLVISDAQLKTTDEIANTVVKAGPGGVIRLSDIADVREAVAPQTTRSRADGRPCVLMNVYQQPGGNTIDIAAGVRDTLARASAQLPKDVAVTCWYDQSDLINSSAHGVRDAVLIGVALAALVLLLFLRNWQMTLIATLAVPAVLAVTALVLHALGQSLNVMTLGGMAAAVGLIIDDAIVMSEHIVRRLHGTGGSGPGALAAADEFTRPLTGSSLSTIIIHLPPAFLVGVFGAFFAALSLSMAASLIVSFFVAWLVIPILAARLLRGVKAQPESGRIAWATGRLYDGVLGVALRVPWLVLLAAAPLLAAGYFAYSRVPSGVLPTIDEGGFVIDFVGPPGASLDEMARLLGHVEAAIKDQPEVLTYSLRTGYGLGGDIAESHTGDFFVRLKPLPRRPIAEVMDAVRERAEAEVPGLEIEPLQLMEDLIGDLTGRAQPVVVNLFGSDEQQLVDLAPKLADQLSKIDGLSSVENGVTPAGDAFSFTVDRVKAALEGVDADVVTRQATALLGGDIATKIQRGEKTIDVRVWTPAAIRRNTDDIAKLELRAPDGHLFPLGRVATFTVLPGEPELTRQDLQRVVAITARSSRDLGSTIRDVQALLDQKGTLPPEV
ncbi:MAG: hypothetical protein JWM57_3175, partial [Phycisphaerales bacterium]|nr:hypothetical protein [Phycisphaerales bacterium]